MGTSEEPLRRRFCRGASCGVVFWICRHCDRGHQYCGERCRRKARRRQRRAANRRHQQSREREHIMHDKGFLACESLVEQVEQFSIPVPAPRIHQVPS